MVAVVKLSPGMSYESMSVEHIEGALEHIMVIVVMFMMRYC
jgi:hypothetical protein